MAKAAARRARELLFASIRHSHGVPTATDHLPYALAAPDGTLVVAQKGPQGSRLLRFDDKGTPVDVFPGERLRESPLIPLRFAANSLLLSELPTVAVQRWSAGGALDTTYGAAGRVDLLPLCTFGDQVARVVGTRSGALVVLTERAAGGSTVVWRLHRVTR